MRAERRDRAEARQTKATQEERTASEMNPVERIDGHNHVAKGRMRKFVPRAAVAEDFDALPASQAGQNVQTANLLESQLHPAVQVTH